MTSLHVVSIKKTQPRATWVEYTTRTLLQNKAIEMFSFPMQRIDIVDLVQKHGIAIAMMVVELNQTKHVNNVFVNPYNVSISMFDGFVVDKHIDAIIEKMVLNSAVIEALKTRTPVQVEAFPNQNIHDFHTKVNLAGSESGHFHRPLRTSNIDLLKLNSKGRSIVERIMKVPGVVEVSIYQYSLTVEKADLFDWSEIEPAVFEAIARQFGDLKITRK
ncbi:MAG: hypothetical protein UW41_C0005G0014 [Candidatus Collierbacteria bacterium GW2011_GWC2_44_18]|uniref:Scaffold protein Nfu/NifU N-terminal domain-containing protein n=2 Tax=Microgenomates group TaxID=1794810 RepID=A0A0G1J911_9BACT|nr:MAG: hypothetical protein UW41_C0005G0014 [Candidatus Collierbacteria bacterium GW2011_GWC2_44_18]KKT67750.1 MAG: hypothetical protein UW60_C0001G0028 [Candidatus Woesebacteria bacterium GW2011_GWA2_44_33]